MRLMDRIKSVPEKFKIAMVVAIFLVTSCLFNFWMYKKLDDSIWSARSDCNTSDIESEISRLRAEVSGISSAVGAGQVLNSLDDRLGTIESKLDRLGSEIIMNCGRFR